MTVQTEECAEAISGKQGCNPVATRLEFEQSIDLTEKCIQGWKDRDQRHVLILQALMKLHSAGERVDGFTPIEILEAAQSLNKHVVLNVADASEAGSRVREYWKKLEGVWSDKAEVLRAQAKQIGLNWVIKPEKSESTGGSGRTSRYYLRCTPIDQQHFVAGEIPSATIAETGSAEIRYFPADISDCNILIRKLGNGLELVGWKRRVFLAVLLSLLIACCVLWVGFFWWFSRIPITGNNQALISTLMIAAAVFATTQPILMLPIDRIVKAPWWLQWGTESILLEWRSPPRYPSKSIKAIQYAAICPICGGTVAVGAKGLGLNRPLRGHCAEAPNSHVFSFDHVTLQGRAIFI